MGLCPAEGEDFSFILDTITNIKYVYSPGSPPARTVREGQKTRGTLMRVYLTSVRWWGTGIEAYNCQRMNATVKIAKRWLSQGRNHTPSNVLQRGDSLCLCCYVEPYTLPSGGLMPREEGREELKVKTAGCLCRIRSPSTCNPKRSWLWELCKSTLRVLASGQIAQQINPFSMKCSKLCIYAEFKLLISSDMFLMRL